MAQKTVNQIVALNLIRARHERGWSLDETAHRLSPHVGRRSTRQNIHQLEHSAGSGKPRTFDANLLVALAKTFELPLLWFFIPPERVETIETGAGATVQAGDLLDLLFMRGWEKIRARLRELPNDERYGFDMAAAAQTIDFYILEALSDIPDLALQLRTLADDLSYALARASMRDAEERGGGALFDDSELGKLPEMPTKKTPKRATDLPPSERTQRPRRSPAPETGATGSAGRSKSHE